MNEALSTLLSFQQGTTTGVIGKSDDVKVKCRGTWPWYLRNSDQANETVVTEIYLTLIKPTRRTNFPKFILPKTLHVSAISYAHHQDFYTVYSTLVYFL